MVNRFFQILLKIVNLLGFDPRKTFNTLRGLPYYVNDLISLNKQRKLAKEKFPFGAPYPCLNDRFSNSGGASGHYFHQDLLVARRISINNPIVHVDIGSRIDGFVAHVASFRHIEVLDIRPLPDEIANVSFRQLNMMEPIDETLLEYCDSLSCLHTIEHFGLGRYGDPVSYDGYLVGLNNIHKMLKTGGKLYFSVPIGPQRIEFNAHRIFSLEYLLELFEGKYEIDHFSFVDDNGRLNENVVIKDKDMESNFGCIYGCGIFEMTKL